MSCDYDITCLDCDECCGFQDANHADGTMRAIIANRLHAERIAESLNAMDGVSFSNSEPETMYGNLPCFWLLKHRGHRLAVVDEYGKLDWQCFKRTKCAHCQTSHQCKLPEGHDGECL